MLKICKKHIFMQLRLLRVLGCFHAADWTESREYTRCSMFLRGKSGMPILAAAMGCFLVCFLIKTITLNTILMEGTPNGGENSGKKTRLG